MNRKSSRSKLCQHILDIVDGCQLSMIFEILPLVYIFILKMLEANCIRSITIVSRI